MNAKDRISNGMYVRVNNTSIIATDKADLLDGVLQNSVSTTATGDGNTDWPMWTGSFSDGTAIANKHCNNWTSSSNGTNGRIGNRSSATIEWTDAYNASDWSGCSTSFGRIYCFED
ncbi:MAG: DUF1554 domain-containing protein [Crocinitomicaceae bacterium]|nr:DUF1554 domain-containing protein [Crocinitomicaceae bacterium]